MRRALEFLEHDDGRPVFLVVHTYRTHMPYRVGEVEDRAPWEELQAEVRGELGQGLLKARKELAPETWHAVLARTSDRYRSLYLQGVAALDAGFGDFLEGLAPRGIGPRAYLFFTSDHGEALGENDDIFHAGDLWESKLRIPLLARGPRFTPGSVPLAVTLLDLAPTLAELAGVPADPRWSGSSLFALDRERPAFAFRLQQAERQLAISQGKHKLLTRRTEALAAGDYDQAFDLAADPREEHDLHGGAAWGPGLAREGAHELPRLLEPATGSVILQLTPEELLKLNGLGYGENEKD